MHLKSAFLLCLLGGVFGADTGNTESVWVMLGDSVTLHTGIGSVRRDHHVVWRFGPDSPGSRVAELMKWSYMLSVFVSGKMPFRDTLQLDHKTGSLTINNTTPEHSGLYKLTIIHNRKTSRKKFDVKVYAPLPVPVISTDSSQDSHRSAGAACVLMCSVTNASRVTLSFFKGSDLVSSVSGSDFNGSLSLPLDVEPHDENTYSCVVNNSISNHTTLFNTTDLCPPPPAASAPLPVPVISTDSSQDSHRSAGAACVLMCSVTNASRVTLSFFKGSDLVSSVSGSDFNGSLSLPLDVEPHDENTYSCVVNNSISNHTTLFNTTDLCPPPPAASAPLPVPVISTDSSQDSHRSAGAACVLMCSVTNASRVTLSFFKGSDLVSSVSGSDFNGSLSLPLDVEPHDENTYSCVVNNSISNHTTLFNTTDLCPPPPAASDESLLYCLLLLLIPVTVIAVLLCVCRKRRKAEQETDENC